MIDPKKGTGRLLLGMALIGASALVAVALEKPEARVPAAKRAIEPIAPPLPDDLVAALQGGKPKEALAILAKLADDPKASADDKAYLALIRAVALRLDGRAEEARKALHEALDPAPKGRWAAKLRAELAAIALAAGKPAEAEALARVEADSLLDGGRKDALADVYRGFAEALLRPKDPVANPDPEGAYALLNQARSLARGDDARASLLLALARASQQANNHPRAIQDFQNYLKEYPKGADRNAARLELGDSLLAAGQGVQARLTWSDLARDLEGKDDRGAARARIDALYRIPSTFGIPNPPDDAQLGLGVAALRRALAADPSHAKAVQAAFDIGAAYQARGKAPEALSAFADFLEGTGYKAEDDDSRRRKADLLMAATFRTGQILLGQEKFAEAIAAWRGYLSKFPDGPQSADAQRSILDAQWLAAAEKLHARQFDEARTALRAFALANPLDPRVPAVLYLVGESFEAEEKYDEAISAYETLAGKFPNTEPAAHAQFQVAAIYENHKGDLPEAIERFRKVAAVEPWHSQALQRVAVMEAKALAVVTPRAYRSGEAAKLRISSRNIETLTFTAYKLDPEAYFRKKHAIGNVEALDVGLVAPDAEWTAEVKGYAKYKPVEADYELDKKVAIPGVWVVKVTDEKTLQATTLVIGSDVDAIVKVSRDQLLVFVQDMKTGKGRAGARVLVAEGSGVVLEAKTGEDGVLLKAWDKPRDPNSPLHYLVLDGPDAAGSGLSVPGQVAQGLTARAYLYTDRPAYRPGQEVELRGVVREVKDGQYAAEAGGKYRLEVLDVRGRRLVDREVTLSEFGTFHDRLPLDPAAPVGVYAIRVHRPGGSSFSGNFEVRAYQVRKVEVTIDLPRAVFFRGETIKGDVLARDSTGIPLANRPVVVQFPDSRTLSGETDAAGKFPIELATEGFAEDQALRIVAQLPQDGVATAANVMLAVHAFRIDLSTTRDVFLAGESFTLEAKTLDAAGAPTGQELSVSVRKRVDRAGRISEREVAKAAIKTDAKTGKGSVSLKIDDEDGGSFVVRVAATDRFGNPVVAEKLLTVSGKKDETKLRILADRQEFKVGETAEVNLHSRGAAGTALLAWEADRILTYKLVALKEGDNPLSWEVAAAQAPEFTLTASRMAGTRFDEARLDVRAERDLRVEIVPAKGSVGPGESVEVAIRTLDQRGRPVAAEVSLALVDRALLRLYGDQLPPIGSFFHDRKRIGAFSTSSTVAFRYAPATRPVSEAVVEEEQLALARAADEAKLGDLRKQAETKGTVDSPELLNRLDEAPEKAPELGGGVAMGEKVAGLAEDTAAGLRAPARSKSKAGSLKRDRFGHDSQLGFGANRRQMALDDDFDAIDGVEAFKELAEHGGPHDKAPAQPRRQVVETAYWNPAIVTDAEGKARITLKAPPALSRYEFTARGVTALDSLAGQSHAEIEVRKDFAVELAAPSSLTEGDHPRFLARLRHRGVEGKAVVRLSVSGGGREVVRPKEVELKGDGVEEVLFEEIDVPEANALRLVATAEAGDGRDEVALDVPVRPWGVPVVAFASGTSSGDATAFVSLPPGREYRDPELTVVVSPTVRRMLIELALGRSSPGPRPGGLYESRALPPTTTADRASDLLAATSTLAYLRAVGADDEGGRLTGRIQGLVAELTAAQGDDGGWPWAGVAGPGDRLTSARAVWALATAEPLGLLTDPSALEKATAFLASEFAKADQADHEARAALLHALATRGKATFEQANALNRSRQDLPDAALAYLALTFAKLDRRALADEVLGVLAPRVKREPAGPGRPDRLSFGLTKVAPWHDPVEATALAALAFGEARPGSPELAGTVDWLLAHRGPDGWQPPKAKGPALAALAKFQGDAKAADDRYRLTITVNGKALDTIEVAGAAEPKTLRVPREALKIGGENAVRFGIEGRGTFGYAVTLASFARDFAPEQDQANRRFLVTQRITMAADPQLDGKPLPTGFGVAVNAESFENWVKQVRLGGRARVRIDLLAVEPPNVKPWEREFLVLQEYLPAGTTLVEGSVQTQASHYKLSDGVLTFFFAPGQLPRYTSYDIFGYLPGKYRALPCRLLSAYDPGKQHLGQPGELTVLAPGEATTDPYKPTPDELYARGKALFDSGRLADAAKSLEALYGGYTLREDVLKDVARMLLDAAIAGKGEPAKIVKYFEVLKEKAPELVLTFEKISVVGKAYLAIGEAERAYLVWRAIAEASYLEDAQVGEALRQRGKDLEAIAYLLDLWRRYPDSAPIRADFFGLSRLVAGTAARAAAEPAVRRQLAAAGLSRPELLLQAIRLTRAALAAAPRDPAADEEGLALVGDLLELGDFEPVVRLAERYASLYPKSAYLDSFQYSEALGRFHLGQYDRAIAVARRIAEARYKDASGAERESPNRWQALYILGQIHEARRQPGEALAYYRQVAERFTDAAGAVKALERKELKLPEVAVVRPERPAAVAGGAKEEPKGAGVGLRAVAPEDPRGRDAAASVKLEYRNVAEADVRVYPVDLMRLYLTRRSLDGIAGVDLAGIRPLLEKKVELGDGADYREKQRELALPLSKDGAYLVMARGGELYASGVVLVSPLELEVTEEPSAGRVRVAVREAGSREPASGVQVKVIGSDGGSFLSGATDLRGVFVAEGVRGKVTAVARRGADQYAFYRGTQYVGTPPPPPGQPAEKAPAGAETGKSLGLEDNLRGMNNANQLQQLNRLNERYNSGGQKQGVQVKDAY